MGPEHAIRSPGTTAPGGVLEARAGRLSSWTLRWRPELIPVAALVLLEVAHALLLFLGHHTYFAFPDNTTQFFAWYQKQAVDWHAGSVPLWDQNTLAGHSFLGETQQGAFYPLNIIWLLALGSAAGIGPHRLDLLVELHLLIASVGMYALARSFRAGRLSALIAAVVFAYVGPEVQRASAQTAIFFALSWTPWAVFCAHRALVRRSLWWSAAAGVPLGLGVLAGHFQPPFNAGLCVLCLYALTTWPAAGRRRELGVRLLAAVVTVLTAAIVALPQLAYTLPYLKRAYRFVGTTNPVPPGGNISFSTFANLVSGGPDSALSLLDPQRYPVIDNNAVYLTLGGLAIVLLVAGTHRSRLWRSLGEQRWAVIAILIIGALTMAGSWTFIPRILYAIPFAAEVRELARYSIMVQLALCLLLAGALDALPGWWASHGPHARALTSPRTAAVAFPRRLQRALLVAGALAALDGIYLIIFAPPASTSWFGVQLLLGGLTVVVLSVGHLLVGGGRLRWVQAWLGLLIVLASFHADLIWVGSTASPTYPVNYYAANPLIARVSKDCAGHRTLILGGLPVNVGDVFRQIHEVEGYGATLQANYFDFLNSSSAIGSVETTLLDERCIVSPAAVSIAGYRLVYTDPTSGTHLYLNPSTSGLNDPGLKPISAQILPSSDRDLRWAVDRARPVKAIISAFTYPGWTVRLDGHRVATGSYALSNGESVFPTLTIPAGRHTVSYSWSGWP
jgi:hypothetical protein